MHIPVLLKEVIEYLEPKPGEVILDATVNGGGHAIPIVEKILPDGKLVGIDRDAEVLEELKSKIKSQKSKIWKNFVLINGNFRDLDELLPEAEIQSIDKALFDLGMSSWHLEKSGRGFTFQKNEPLDMRYDTKIKNAEDLVNKLPERKLEKILKEYGEERFAKRIAKEIVKNRKEKPIRTTFELVEIILKAVPEWYRRGRRHFATKTFQALRIAVNDELEALKQGLAETWKFLSPNGRLAVITFHSLEDRIVKTFFRQMEKETRGKILTSKPIMPSLKEKGLNPRSRSAKLRVIAKIANY